MHRSSRNEWGRRLLLQAYRFVAGVTPGPIRRMVEPLRLDRISHLLEDKYETELRFQSRWAEEYRTDQEVALRYWKEYRCLEEIESRVTFDPSTRVLDVGCGLCTVLRFLAGEKYGLDPNADAYLELCEFPDDIRLLRGVGERIPFAGGFFDVVFCSNVLDHVSRPRRVVEEIHRVLRPGGHFVLTVELHEERLVRDAAHPHAFGEPEVIGLVEGPFTIALRHRSPWVGMRNFLHGRQGKGTSELVLLLRRG